MTVTKEQAFKGREFHVGTCVKTIGPRGGESFQCENWRANGQLKTWKTRPDEFSLPIKYGLYGHSYLTDENAQAFHRAEDCKPTIIDQRKKKGA